MRKAYIYYDDIRYKDSFNEEGLYLLVTEDGEVIGSHISSNRSFANHDLTVWRLKELDQYNIDEVVSGGMVVWRRNDEKVNKKTDEMFQIANIEYEMRYCND